MSRAFLWRMCWLAAIVLSVVTFTPLVTPPGQYQPSLAGIPLTLWAGGLIAFALVGLTYLVGLVHPESGQEDEEAF